MSKKFNSKNIGAGFRSIPEKTHHDVLLRSGLIASNSRQLWAIYQLGCYRSAITTHKNITCSRDALAILVSAAACGKRDLLNKSTSQLIESGDLDLIGQACLHVARYDLATAKLLSTDLKGQYGIKIELSMHQKNADATKELIDAAKAFSFQRDTILQQANICDSDEAKTKLFNLYLEASDLSLVRLLDSNRCFGPHNILGHPSTTHSGPLVSVIMTTHNSAKTVDYAIRSILDQSYRNLELIIVDDASSDNTLQLVKHYSSVDSRIKVIALERNIGTFAAKNRALNAANGDFVTCNDSDDWSHPERILRQVVPLLGNSEAVSSISKFVRVSEEGLFTSKQIYPLTRANVSSLLYRKAAIRRLGMYHPVRTGADSEYLARMKLVFGSKTHVSVDLPLAVASQRNGSLSSDISRGCPVPTERLAYWENWTKRHLAWRRSTMLRRFGSIVFTYGFS